MQMCFFVTQNVIFRAYCLIVVVVTVVITSKGFSLQRGIFNLDASLRCTTSHRWQKCDNDPISWPRALPDWIQDPALFPWGGEQSCNAPYSLGCEFVLGSVNKVYSGIKQAPQKHRARNQTDTKQEGVLSHFVILHRGPWDLKDAPVGELDNCDCARLPNWMWCLALEAWW